MIPVFQGVKKEVVNKICHQGFGTACVLDEGYYGKGSFFYFLFPNFFSLFAIWKNKLKN